VALAIAAISMPDLVPSMKEQNIWAFMPASAACSAVKPVLVPHVGRRQAVVSGLVAGALAGGDHRKAARARPVDHLADERRLVAVGHRVDGAGAARLRRQVGPRQHVGLDIDHDDVLALGRCGKRMADAGQRIAGRLDHHLDVGLGDHRNAVLDEAGARNALLAPADVAAGGFRPLDVEVGDANDVDMRRGRHLREEHRAELARPDEADPDGPGRLDAAAQARWQQVCRGHAISFEVNAYSGTSGPCQE
jgi:hypothetical protein